jgi:hypothetical protein
VPLILDANIIELLVENLKNLTFEARKQAASVINFVVRRSAKNGMPEYLADHSGIITLLLDGLCESPHQQLSGTILTEIAKRGELAPVMLSLAVTRADLPLLPTVSVLASGKTVTSKVSVGSGAAAVDAVDLKSRDAEDESDDEDGGRVTAAEAAIDETKAEDRPSTESVHSEGPTATVSPSSAGGGGGGDAVVKELDVVDAVGVLFVLAHDSDLIVATSAFEVLQQLSLKHKRMSREYIEANMLVFFAYMNGLVMSDNFVTQGKFLKLLADIVLAKKNAKIRVEYVSDKDNLRIIMTLLRSTSSIISHEAFHIFKVFAANPNKPRDIHIILWKNRDKLKRFIIEFQVERAEEDEAFKIDKQTVLTKLDELETPPEVAEKIAALKEASVEVEPSKPSTEETTTDSPESTPEAVKDYGDDEPATAAAADS